MAADFFLPSGQVGFQAESAGNWRSRRIIPNALMVLMSDPDRAKAGRVQAAMMQIVKLDVAGLEQASGGG